MVHCLGVLRNLAPFIFTAAIILSPGLADTRLPARTNGEDIKHEVLTTTVSFFTTKVISYKRRRERGIVEQAVILACNEAHPHDKLHMTEAAIQQATCKNNSATVTSVAPTMIRRKAAPAIVSNEQQGQTYVTTIELLGNYVCKLCNNNDDDDLVVVENRSFFDNSNSTTHEEWEHALCMILGQYEVFDGTAGCQIQVNSNEDEKRFDSASVIKG
jgi:hypothetical protein